MKQAALLLAVLALAGGGCGGGSGDAQDVLRETAANLGDIRSGDLSLELVFTAKDGSEGGFTLAGPFALDQGPLVAGRLEFTQVGAESGNTAATFISTGEEAFAEVAGTAYELTPEMTEQVRAASGQLQAGGGLEQLDLTAWLEEPSLEDGGDVGGADTDLVRARLNVAEVLNTLLALAAQLGGAAAPPRLEGENAERLTEATRSSNAEVYTGKDDRLLRRVALVIEFEPAEAPEDLAGLLGGGIRFVLEISDPNMEVAVEAPADPRPYSELGG